MPICDRCKGKLKLIGKARESSIGRLREVYICLACGHRVWRVV